jgi:uncharacterized protein (DUF2461 family)
MTPDLTPVTQGVADAGHALLDANLTLTSLGYALEDGVTQTVIELVTQLQDRLYAVRMALGSATHCHRIYQDASGDSVERLKDVTDYLRVH